MPHHYIRQLMGHRRDPLTRTYFSTPSEKLREEYQKFMHNLNFSEQREVRQVESRNNSTIANFNINNPKSMLQ